MPRKDLAARKEYSRAQYLKNREEFLKKCKAYAQKNAAKISERNRRRRLERIEFFRAYEESRKEARAVERKRRYEEDPLYREELLRRAREWKAAHREWCRENKEKWDAENKDHREEYGKKRWEEKKEELSAIWRAWRLQNPEYMRAQANKRRAAKEGSGGQFRPNEIRDLWEKQNGLCAYFSVCGNKLGVKGFGGAHRDHIEPLIPADPSRPPGANTIDNIQLLCRRCNQQKRNKDPYAFTQSHAGTLFPDLPKSPKKKSPKKDKK